MCVCLCVCVCERERERERERSSHVLAQNSFGETAKITLTVTLHHNGEKRTAVSRDIIYDSHY